MFGGVGDRRTAVKSRYPWTVSEYQTSLETMGEEGSAREMGFIWCLGLNPVKALVKVQQKHLNCGAVSQDKFTKVQVSSW